MLSDAQIERYSRQIILPQFGGKGQEKILRSRVLVHTEGLLEAAALLYLAAAGVGTIGIVRSQSVTSKTSHPVFSALAEDASGSDQNGLNEQDEQDGQNEQDVRIKTLRRLNPDCTIITHIGGDDEKDDLRPEQLVQHYDLVLGATAVLHDACYVTRKPFIWAHLVEGQAYLFV